ncbi:MAG: hypothetical protein KF726_04215 [Anaerolineae bacterium]|nr:hypothetical protein [Anaerolineae bacterium]
MDEENLSILKSVVVLNAAPEAWRDIAFNSDGTLLATARRSATVLWDMKTGGQFATIADLQINDLTFSPDGTLLAGVEGTSTIHLWEVTTSKQVATFESGDYAVALLTFTPDGKHLIVLTENGEVQQWLISSGERINTHKSSISKATRLAFSPDGSRLVLSGREQDKIEIWDALTWNKVTDLSLAHNANERVNVYQLFFSTDGKYLTASVGTLAPYLVNSTLSRWDTQNWQQIDTSGIQLSSGISIMNPDGTLIAEVQNNTIQFRDGLTGSSIFTLRNISAMVFDDSLLFSPDGSQLADKNNNLIIVLGVPSDFLREGIAVELLSSVNKDGPHQFKGVIPEQWLTKAGNLPQYRVRIRDTVTVVDTCEYNFAKVDRVRFATIVEIYDTEKKQIIDKRQFEGGDPGGCPFTITITIGGDNRLKGTPPSQVEFSEWFSEVMAEHGFTATSTSLATSTATAVATEGVTTSATESK